MKKIVFASDELPAELDDQARFKLWRDIYTSLYGDADVSRLPDRPFSSRSEFMQVGAIGLVQSEGTVNRVVRTARHVAADTRGDFLIGFGGGGHPFVMSQRGRETTGGPARMLLYTTAEAVECSAAGPNAWSGLCVPRAKILELVTNADDRVMEPLDPARPAVRHLRRYLDFLLASDEIADDPQLAGHISTTLLDLIALSLGANDDVAQVAQMRGLRAARAQEILAEIKTGFANQAFSPSDIAVKLGLSPRYVQDLLQETGTSFTERVLELRLQKARAMLAAERNDRVKISDIAFSCGFSNVSYFNQCFRRRFGASPTQYRGAGKAGQT